LSWVYYMDAVIYAQWLPDVYVITLDAQGGSSGPDTASTNYFMLTPMSTPPTKSYYLIVGWFTEAGYGKGTGINRDTKFEKNTTIYAHWAEPWIYGDDNKLTDPRDDKSYRKVTIGEYVWVAENLNWDGTVDGKPANPPIGVCYGNAPKNCDVYGRLYTFDEAKEACPTGWVLTPSAAYVALTRGTGTAVSAEQSYMLRSKGYWEPTVYAQPTGTDDFGFSALPSGYSTAGGVGVGLGDFFRLWLDGGTTRFITPTGTGTQTATVSAGMRASVRCVQQN